VAIFYETKKSQHHILSVIFLWRASEQ